MSIITIRFSTFTQMQQSKLFQKCALIYQQSMYWQFGEKLCLTKRQQKGQSSENPRCSISAIIHSHLNDKRMIGGLLDCWQYQSVSKCRNIGLKIEIISVQSDQSIEVGSLELKGQEQSLATSVFTQSEVKQTHQDNHFLLTFLKPAQFLVSSIQIFTPLQIYLTNLHAWKSQTFCCHDLRKISLSNQKSMYLTNSIGNILLIRLKFSLGSDQIFEDESQLEISPAQFLMIDKLYSAEIPRVRLLNGEQMMKFYQKSYFSGRLNTWSVLSFHHLDDLFALLAVDKLIFKFYASSPFNEMEASSRNPSQIYLHYSNSFQQSTFYELLKYRWKFNRTSSSRLLIALKSFDQNNRFNYTSHFFLVTEKIHSICKLESFFGKKNYEFNQSAVGVESSAFFVMLALVKKLPSIFMRQSISNKMSLPTNSLLFHYILVNKLPKINQKLSLISMNIEAFFGIEYISLLSACLEDELFCQTLFEVIREKNQAPSSLLCHTLIGAFFTLLEQVDLHEQAYISAENFICFFKEINHKVGSQKIFFANVNKWVKESRKTSQETYFVKLLNSMEEFYAENVYEGNFDCITRQIYDEFVNLEPKNELDLRKIHLIIDRIVIDEEKPSDILCAMIFQNSCKLFEHNFKRVDLNNLHHPIEAKLLRLDKLLLIFNTCSKTYSCEIDPQEFASNYYLHTVCPLQCQQQSDSHENCIFFQIYLKDSSEIEYLQNPLPQLYVNQILLPNVSKEDVLFAARFQKAFRMKENNFNLLYSKLGWYGGHYLIADERLLYLQATNNLASNQVLSEAEYNYKKRIGALSKYNRYVYGKAIIPRPEPEILQVSLELLKGSVHAWLDWENSWQNNQSEGNQYNSATHLLCYILHNFDVFGSFSFPSFHFRLKDLPNFDYLIYEPVLTNSPCFSFQVRSNSSTCIVRVSTAGSQLKSHFTAQEIELIEEQSSQYAKLPEKMEISFGQANMSLDEFLKILRWNLLRGVSGKKIEAVRWPNSIRGVGFENQYPNYPLWNFFELMIETSHIAQFEFKEHPLPSNHISFSHFASIFGRWLKVAPIITIENQLHELFYLCECQINRKRYLLKANELILTSTVTEKMSWKEFQGSDLQKYLS